MNHTVWYVYEVFARFLYVLVCFHTSTYTTICIWEKSKRRPSNLLTFTRSATHVLRCVPSRLTMNHWLGPCFLNPSDAPVRLAQEQQRPELSLKRCLAARDFEKNRWKNMGVSKNSGFSLKMDGENNGKPYLSKWMIWGGNTHYFRKHPYYCGSVITMDDMTWLKMGLLSSREARKSWSTTQKAKVLAWW